MRAPEFWTSNGVLAHLLAPLGFFQGASVARKARRARPYRAPAKIVCVGNLTAGGSGKTPAAIAVARALKGTDVFFLTRGYGGHVKGPHRVLPGDEARAVGDEALLLARIAPTIVAADRRAGAMLAGDVDVIVMDDGHQNFSLAKDISIVMVDGGSGFGNGRMIPAGPLREPVVVGLARADAVMIVGAGDPDLEGFSGPVLRAHLAADAPELNGRRVFAFAGIGRPEKFLATLEACGAVVTGTRFFADHHVYSDREIAALRARAGDAVLITTEKDLVRLTPAQAENIETLKVTLVLDEPQQLAALLDRVRPDL